MMSPNKLLLTITSYWAGSSTMNIALASTHAKALHVRFVGHRHALALVQAGIFESGDDDPFHAFSRVKFLLRGNLFPSALLQKTAGATIRAFGVFSKDDEIDLLDRAISQWR